jgi:hypothetical protein
LITIVLWCSYLLGGGHTIGGGHTPSREALHLSDSWLESLVGEVAHLSNSWLESLVGEVAYKVEIEQQRRRVHHAWVHLPSWTCIAA